MQTSFTMYTASGQKIEVEADPGAKFVIINCEKVDMDAKELEVFIVQLALAESLIKKSSEPDYTYNDDTVFLPPDAL